MSSLKHKGSKVSSNLLAWKAISIIGLVFGTAGLIMGIVSLTQKDNDTKYVIPDTSAIIPFYNATFNTRLQGSASNAPNVTIMLERKGNDVILQFPWYYGNFSSGLAVNTDAIPLQYAQVNASNPTQVLYSPQEFIQVVCDAGTKLGLAAIDSDKKLYLYYDFDGAVPWSGNCYVYPFTIVYFRDTTYEQTVPL
jgi:hypothetical protein